MSYNDIKVCMHTRDVNCENCGPGFTLPRNSGGPYVTPIYTCKHGVAQSTGWSTCAQCGQELHVRAMIDYAITVLQSDPQLAARLRDVLGLKKP